VEGTWTILELAQLAAETLAAAGPPALMAPDGIPARANGRVRDVPTERLIRWYATVGLVDPPLSRQGRVAQYGRRHLLQLVAVKRRQAEGRSLAEIQAELAGATDEALARIAVIPDTTHRPAHPASTGSAGSGPVPPGPAGPARFWARPSRQPSQPPHATYPPAAQSLATEPTTAQAAAESLVTDSTERPAPTAVISAGLIHGVRLAPGVTLLLEDADHEPSPAELTEIVNASRSLLRELADRGLLKGAGLDHRHRATGV
jgi:hypothetical protein